MQESTNSHDVTRMLAEIQRGDQSAFNALFQLVYAELHQIAHRAREKWAGDYTVNTTALVHEVYEKLLLHPNPDWESRMHFLRVAAKAMRRILINYARDKRAQKRGGGIEKISLETDLMSPVDSFVISDEQALQLIALDDAMQALEEINERQVRIVECRFFAGMELKETAQVLGISEATVKRGWVAARAWLYDAMTEKEERIK